MEQNKTQYVEGLRRLIESVRQIEFVYWSFKYAVRTAKTQDFTSHCSLGEVKEWRKFSIDICAELDAAAKIGIQEFEMEMPATRKLSATLDGKLELLDSSLIRDAVAEITATADRVGSTISDHVLTENDVGLLEAMIVLDATADSPASLAMILSQAKWESEGKRALDRLKEYGLVATKKGVGFYLTKSGIERAKKIGKRT